MIILQDDGGVVARGTRIILGADITLTEDATGLPVINAVLSGGSVSGSGTTDTIAKWSSSSAITDSVITEVGGNILINAATAATGSPRLDVLGTTLATASMTLGNTASDATLKHGTLSVRHYTNAEEPFGFIAGRISSSVAAVQIGSSDAGSHPFNAATIIQFYTAADTTTLTGTLRMSIDSAGAANFQSNFVSMGHLGVGATANDTVALLLQGSLTTGTDQTGITLDPLFGSDATSTGRAMTARVRTEAASFTMTNAYSIRILSPSVGAGSTITTAYGLKVENQSAAGTNYAIHTGTGLLQFGDAATFSSTVVMGGLTATSGKFTNDVVFRETDDGNNAVKIDVTGTYGVVDISRGGTVVTRLTGQSAGDNFINNGGNLLVGTQVAATGTPRLDVVGGIALTLSDNTTNATNKIGLFNVRHYTNAEESQTIIRARSSVGANLIQIGGGSGTQNAATDIEFYTAASTTTLTGTLRMLINTAGNLVIGTPTPASGSPRLDVVGARALVVSDTATDATNKVSRIGGRHYTNVEEALALVVGSSTSTTSVVAIGGGTSLFNAATLIRFYTAANTTTTGGTIRLDISSSGAANFQGNAVTMGALTAASGSFTTPLPTASTVAKIVSVVGGVGIDATAGENPSLSLDVGELTIGPVPLDATDYLIALNSTLTRRQLISAIELDIFSNTVTGYTSNTGDITQVSITTAAGLDGTLNTTSGNHVQTISLNFDELTDRGPLIISDRLVVVDGSATGTERIDQIPLSLFENDITIGDVLVGTDHLIAQNGSSLRRQLISTTPLGIFSNDQGWTANAGTVTSVGSGTGLTGGPITGSGTINLDCNTLTDSVGNLITSDHLVAVNGTATVRQHISLIPLSIFNNDLGWTTNVGDVTGVSAGSGISVGSSGGPVPSVAVDSTVIRTTGAQSLGGIKTFTSDLRAADGDAANPSYSFTNEIDCGMYKSNTNQVSFATNGLELLRLNGARRVQLHDGGVVTNVAGVVVSTSAPVSQDNVEGTIWCKV